MHARGPARALLVAALSLALSAPAATAHTELTSTTPKAGSYAKRSLSTARVRFNQPIRSGRLQVLRAGEKVSTGSGRRSPGNVRAIEAQISQELAAGVYVARWTMTAVDGPRNAVRGASRSARSRRAPVSKKATTAAPTAEPSPSVQPEATVQPASAADDGGGATGVLVGGAALVGVLVAGGLVAARRRRS